MPNRMTCGITRAVLCACGALIVRGEPRGADETVFLLPSSWSNLLFGAAQCVSVPRLASSRMSV